MIECKHQHFSRSLAFGAICDGDVDYRDRLAVAAWLMCLACRTHLLNIL